MYRSRLRSVIQLTASKSLIPSCGNQKFHAPSSSRLATSAQTNENSEEQNARLKSIQTEISELKKSIRKLSKNADPSDAKLQHNISQLHELQKQLADEGIEENIERKLLKRVKGARDFGPASVALRDKIIQRCVAVFETHCAVPLDTPIFELTEIMDEKYSDEAHNRNFIYDLKDTTGESLSLRYDLTVPFARYLASNKIRRMRRYQIGKVYRKEASRSIARGRLREFLQADFDIAGGADPMITESECILVAQKIFASLGFKNIEVRVNHRLLLEQMLSAAEIPVEKQKQMCSLIDSLDKKDWKDIRDECMIISDLPSAAVDALEHFILMRVRNEEMSNEEFLDNLKGNPHLNGAQSAIEQLELLLNYCKAYGIDTTVKLDPTLVRGLDYYTGVVFEVIIKDSSEKDGSLGTVAAGGRYDDLVAALSPVDFSVPCVGLSVGIDRILSIVEHRKTAKPMPITSKCDVYVCAAPKGMTEDRLKLTALLWQAGIKADTSRRANPSILNQFQTAEKQNIPLALVFGPKELKEDTVILRDVLKREEKLLPKTRIVDEIKRLRNTDKWALKSG